MNDVFLKILNMSIAATWLIPAVLLARLLLKNAPKWSRVLLWALVAARLVLPFSFESSLSLLPSAQTIPADIETAQEPTIHSGLSFLNSAVNPIIQQTAAPTPEYSVNPMQVYVTVFTAIWLAGVAAMLLYALISYLRLRRRVRTAFLLRDHIYQCEFLDSPFVLGIIRPRIYLPYPMDGQDMDYVIAHEQAHLRRRDHWWKPIGFLLLAIHWFNPLLWLAYILLCRDIELACDEKVISALKDTQRADYTQALLSCSCHRRSISACPLAFGEVGVKERVRSVLHYKKPAFWVVVAAIVACIALGVCFLTDPKAVIDDPPDPTASWPALKDTRQDYTAQQAAEDGCVVVDNSTLLSGEKLLADFINDSAMGRPAALRVYQSYSNQGDSYYVKELRYDGQAYHLQFYARTGDTKEEFLYQCTYKYFKRDFYVWNSRISKPEECFLLFDDPRATAQGKFGQMVAASVSPEEGEIYSNCDFLLTCDPWLYNAWYGFAFSDIDGDGIEEKCCLGIGRTSGLFSFALNVYQGEELEYETQFVSMTQLRSLRFLQAEDRTLQITGVTYGDEPETYVFDLVLRKGELSLKESISETPIPLPYPEPSYPIGETIPGMP